MANKRKFEFNDPAAGDTSRKAAKFGDGSRRMRAKYVSMTANNKLSAVKKDTQMQEEGSSQERNEVAVNEHESVNKHIHHGINSGPDEDDHAESATMAPQNATDEKDQDDLSNSSFSSSNTSKQATHKLGTNTSSSEALPSTTPAQEEPTTGAEILDDSSVDFDFEPDDSFDPKPPYVRVNALFRYVVIAVLVCDSYNDTDHISMSSLSNILLRTGGMLARALKDIARVEIQPSQPDSYHIEDDQVAGSINSSASRDECREESTTTSPELVQRVTSPSSPHEGSSTSLTRMRKRDRDEEESSRRKR